MLFINLIKFTKLISPKKKGGFSPETVSKRKYLCKTIKLNF